MLYTQKIEIARLSEREYDTNSVPQGADYLEQFLRVLLFKGITPPLRPCLCERLFSDGWTGYLCSSKSVDPTRSHINGLGLNTALIIADINDVAASFRLCLGDKGAPVTEALVNLRSF
jgi:hypothetical protein